MAHPVKQLALKDITVDPSINPRAGGLSEAVVEDYAEAFGLEAEFPPLVVYQETIGAQIKNWLSEGFHRYAGATQAGVKRLPCEIRKGNRADAEWNALGSNQGHGLRRSNKDKRLATERAVTKHPEYSNERIGKHVGVGDDLVADVRKKLGLDTAERVGSDGVKQPAKKPQSSNSDKTPVSESETIISENPLENAKQAEKAPSENLSDSHSDDSGITSAEIPIDEPSSPPLSPTRGGINFDFGFNAPGAKAAEGVAFDGPVRESDPEDPMPDPRFMPNVGDAAILAGQFRHWKARLESIRADIRKAFPGRATVMARRIDARGHFDAMISDLIETLDKNIPEHVCPPCCGTGVDDTATKCRFCDGYGIVDKHHHAGLKARWKRTAGRLAELVSAAETQETAA